MRMLNRKACVVLVAMGILIIGSADLLLALSADYNRPNPLLDYAPQDIGMYDARYDELGELDCRACHGDSLADRHHYAQGGFAATCDPCHELIPEPPGVVIIRDCTTSGCHGWDDVLAGNGWHHATDLLQAENCVMCHNPNLVGPIGPFLPFAEYPPSVVTPTPFSCENCHWEQDLVQSSWAEGDPPPPQPDAGHPSTYDHYDPWGNFLGYHEYGWAILGNFDTHHMGFKGNVAAQCSQCHGNEPGYQPWDPYNPELIRYCEKCHDLETLHKIEPHVGPGGTGNPVSVSGWVATGFHAGGGGYDPPEYRPFSANETCWGCHSDPVWLPSLSSGPFIRINPRGINPSAVQAVGLVELTGKYFGDTYGEYTGVEVKRRIDGTEWIDMPVYSWADDRVLFEIPCRTLTAGNYWMRIRNEYGVSNQVVLTFKGDG